MKKCFLNYIGITLFFGAFFFISCHSKEGNIPKPDVPCVNPDIVISDSGRSDLSGREMEIKITVEGSLYTGVAYLPPGFTENSEKEYSAVWFISRERKAPKKFGDLDILKTIENSVKENGQTPFVYIGLPGIDFYDRFEDVLIHHLVPLLRSEFRLSEEKQRQGIGGISSGGAFSSRMFFKYPGLFSVLGQHSAAISKHDIEVWDTNLSKRKDIKECSFFMNVGTEDPLIEVYEKVVPLIEERGIDCLYLKGKGGHDFYYYSEVFPQIIKWYGESVNP